MTLGKYRGWETFAKYLNFIQDSSQNSRRDIIYIMSQNNICNVVYQLDAKFIKICNCLKKKSFLCSISFSKNEKKNWGSQFTQHIFVAGKCCVLTGKNYKQTFNILLNNMLFAGLKIED